MPFGHFALKFSQLTFTFSKSEIEKGVEYLKLLNFAGIKFNEILYPQKVSKQNYCSKMSG